MYRMGIFLLALLLCLLLWAGCGADAEPTELLATNPVTETPTEAETDNLFIAYQLAICSPKLAVHSGPGYGYEIVEYITDQGDYVIIAHESENLGDGQQTTWGKLQTQQGWINLDDALAKGAAENLEEDVPVETIEEEFEPYLLKVQNQYLPIHSGPGYGYDNVDVIEGGGTYTIVEEAIERFNSGMYVTWGKLKSGVGWICIDDAKLTPDILPPYRCTECGRADVYVSRYGLCEACHKKADAEMDYGCCEICGKALNFSEANRYDGTRCNSCCVCDYCGIHMDSAGEIVFESHDKMVYACMACFDELYICSSCRTSSYPAKTKDGLCESCYDATSYCTHCDTRLHEGNTAYNGFGKCVDCYYETLDPAYICDNCGADCSFRGVYEGLCEDCYENS